MVDIMHVGFSLKDLISNDTESKFEHMFFSKTDDCSMAYRPSNQVQYFAEILNSINILKKSGLCTW